MTTMRALMKSAYLGVYGFTHLIVDAVCIGIVLMNFNGDTTNSEMPLMLLIVYNLVAFGMQPFFGYLADRTRRSKEIAIVGMMFVGAAVAILSVPNLAIAIAALGNAMFHVGGGIASLYAGKGKATLPGFFVAPGAIGVFLAIYLAESTRWMFVCGVLLLLCAIYFSLTDYEKYIEYETTQPRMNGHLTMMVLALLSVICVRAIIGGALDFTWKSDMFMKLMVLSMIVGGKAMGGILGDRFGFAQIGIGGLLIAAPLLSAGMNTPVLALIGLFAFNLTMPITLTLLGNALKAYKGFAFGLTTLALAVGYLIDRYVPVNYTNNALFIAAIILLSALWLSQGLLSHDYASKSRQITKGLES